MTSNFAPDSTPQSPQTIEEIMASFEVEDAPLPDGDIGQGLKFHTNRCDTESDRCDGSSPHGRHNSSFRFTVSF